MSVNWCRQCGALIEGKNKSCAKCGPVKSAATPAWQSTGSPRAASASTSSATSVVKTANNIASAGSALLCVVGFLIGMDQSSIFMMLGFIFLLLITWVVWAVTQMAVELAENVAHIRHSVQSYLSQEK